MEAIFREARLYKLPELTRRFLPSMMYIVEHTAVEHYKIRKRLFLGGEREDLVNLQCEK